MGAFSEADKEVAALILVIGLVYVLVKVTYEHFVKEKFTLFHIIHPVQKITAKERQFIASFLMPFNSFDSSQKRLFLKRFSWFRSKMKFTFYGTIGNKEELKAYVSASAVLLTMGMRSFQYVNSVKRIVFYPSKYYSKINRRHHLGEYNPRLKILVFAADTLKEGFQIPNDNINLGIHECSHALCYEMKKNIFWESRRFRYGLRKLNAYFNDSDFMEGLEKEGFFRAYAHENVLEFFAVLTESLVESPFEFKTKHPQLHTVLQTMYGFEFQNKL